MDSFVLGLDLYCGPYHTNYTVEEVNKGKVKESEIDNALNNLYTTLMRLGFFDGSSEYQNQGKDAICNKTNTDLVAEAAKQGIVLSKNDNSSLPFNNNTQKYITVVGPHVNACEVMIGNYACKPIGQTIFKANKIRSRIRRG